MQLLRFSILAGLLLAACMAPAPQATAPTAAPAAATTVAQAGATLAAAAPTVAAVAPTVAAAARPAQTAIAQAAPTVAAAVGTVATAVAKTTAPPVTLNLWHGMNGSEPGTQGGTLKQLVDQYKQVAPNVTINLDFTPYTANELPEKVTA